MDTRFPPFTVTPAAVEALERLGGAVRVDLDEGGCCGTTWSFSLAGEQAHPDDERYGCPGAWLHVSPAAGALLEGATLDHGPRLKPPRFRVEP